jgi:hypothetical protein
MAQPSNPTQRHPIPADPKARRAGALLRARVDANHGVATPTQLAALHSLTGSAPARAKAIRALAVEEDALVEQEAAVRNAQQAKGLGWSFRWAEMLACNRPADPGSMAAYAWTRHASADSALCGYDLLRSVYTYLASDNRLCDSMDVLAPAYAACKEALDA